MTITATRPSLKIVRHFTTDGVHPYDTVDWERRDARITDYRTGAVAFEQLGIEVPSHWSVNATNILAQKYFRGVLGSPERETSLRQVVDRVVDTITAWGVAGGYFEAGEAEIFSDELKHLIIHQRAAFNSPVWFNIGVSGVPQQASACFILEVDDSMSAILNWYTEEGTIFKGGSGAGVNLSAIRSSRELLTGGGTASGPVSFMRGADASAGTIKSGGKTRRAAKMVVLDVDHPDIEEFIWCKVREEDKSRALRAAGFDMDLDGADSASVQYQNANNSVRVSDAFMKAVDAGTDWDLIARTTGEIIESVPARKIFHDIAEAAWRCADPGMQFATTINSWNTTPGSGEIVASNPCFPGSARVHTDKGLLRFDDLVDRSRRGEPISVYTHDITNESPEHRVVLTVPEAVMLNGIRPIIRLIFDNGADLRCTPNHRLWTANRGYVEAAQLTDSDDVYLIDLPTPGTRADYGLPVSVDPNDYLKGYEKAKLALPDAWTENFAHYLGWLIGDGWMTATEQVATVYAPGDPQTVTLPRHQQLLEEVSGVALKAVVRPNGCAQLSYGRRAFHRFLLALGAKAEHAPLKEVPWSVFQAPPDIQAAFLRGLFDSDGTVISNLDRGAYVGLSSTSVALLQGAQKILASFGVFARIYEVRGAQKAGIFPYHRKDGTLATYQSHQLYDLRISSQSMTVFAEQVGFDLPCKADRLHDAIADRKRAPYVTQRTARMVTRVEDGLEPTYNLTEPRNHSYIVDGVVVANCSEHLRLNNSACNLASLNLLQFLSEDGVFDTDGFQAAVHTVFVAQDILVGNADYPTEKIAAVTRDFRDLGLGYANLGATLMALGLAYDSEEGRCVAAGITALMTGTAYATSATIAARLGAFPAYSRDGNETAVVSVLERHQAVLSDVPTVGRAVGTVIPAAVEAFDTAISLARSHGVRNAEATVLAPTGTISFLMDCDTTGIEPDLGLVKTKKLVGGGTMAIVNQTISRALYCLGYNDAATAEIVAYIEDNHSCIGAPGLRPEHLSVFATSMGDNTIDHSGHVSMMAAVQPFISGAISKTVNVPESATVSDIEQIYRDAWASGVKAIAIYRDNCKVGQPLSTSKPSTTSTAEGSAPSESVAPTPARQRLPRMRNSKTWTFTVSDCEGYVTVGEYDDGRPGEIFMKVSKQGSTLAGVMDAFSIAVSVGLQHGVPLQTLIEKYTNMRFEPAGITDDPDLRISSSLVDYIFRRLALQYIDIEERRELGILSTAERTEQTLPGLAEEDLAAKASAVAAVRQHDAPFCLTCGVQMQRAGSCFVCSGCGVTSGCS